MKPEDKVLTYEQAKELKWFARNILGTRQEFYAALDQIEKYKEKIDRLGEQSQMIMDYCEKNGIKLLGEETHPSGEKGSRE